MERLNALAEGLKHVARLLAEDVLEPDASRTDWAELGVRVGMVRQGMDEVLAVLDGALEEAEDTESKALVRQRVAELAGRTAALVFATGDTDGFRALMERALNTAERPEQRARLEAGQRDPVHFCLYERSVWAWGRGRAEVARELMKRVAGKSREKTLKELAREGLRGTDPSMAPRPLEKAPALFRINGCGVGLYGKRDEAPDGTYVATYFISLVFIPVFPLTAYRVRQADPGSWQFFTQEPLGPVARVWQRLVLVGLAGMLAWTGVDGYLNSPERLARLALEDARTAEATLSPEEALSRYHAVLSEHDQPAVLSQAADAVVRLSLVQLPSPCTRDSDAAVERLLAKLTLLPPDTRPGGAMDVLARRLDRCAGEIGQATEEQIQAALAVEAKAQGVVGGHPLLQQRHASLTRALADRAVTERPLRALALYTELSDERDRDAARAVLDSFGEAPSLWLEAADSVEDWLARSDVDASSPEAQRAQERLAQARATHTKDAALIEEGDEAKLVQALKASPGDQELTAAVAGLRMARGEVAEAQAQLQALGPGGRLTGEVQVLIATCHRERGELKEADAVLSAFISERIPAFQRAARAYDEQAEALHEEYRTQARAGRLPGELEKKLEAASGEDEQRRLYQEWVSAQLEQEPRLEKPRATYLRHQPVVPASLLLGLVKLQRAQGEPEEARAALLGEAEQVFLAVRREAEDNPRFHLGLGQVYHRLGRGEEGDAELRRLVERGEPKLTLEVAEAYRELGRTVQSKSLASVVYTTAGETEVKHRAALQMAALANDDLEREAWLLKGDTASTFIQGELLELRARRAAGEGRLEEADGLLAQYVARNLPDAKHHAAASNNVALALLRRFEMTGQLEHLRAAVGHLETAVRLAPDNAVVVGNLADAREHLGQVSVLERWVRTRVLRPSQGEAERLVDLLLETPLRAELLRALDAEPSLRRGQELAQQEQILAPGKAEAWERRLRWLEQRRDTRGLEALARRLEPLPPFTQGSDDEVRERLESGTEDEQLVKAVAQRLLLARATLARAEQTRHAPTIAAAWHLLGDARWRQYAVEWKPEQLAPTVEAYREATGRWAALDANSNLDGMLFLTAVQRSTTKSEALAKVWAEKRRTVSTASLVHHALTGPGGEQVARVLQEQPELREAVERARRRAPKEVTLSDWVMAKAAGDGVLEQAAAALLTRPDVELSLSLSERLAGDHAREQAARELFQKARAGGALP